MYDLLRSILFSQDPENIHHRMVALCKILGKTPFKNLFSWTLAFDHPKLHSKFLGIDFANPVGLAAGFDKDGDLVDFLPSLGFGFLEIGSITGKPTEGNPKPRLFRLPNDEALINRLGLPNDGVKKIKKKLLGKTFKVPIGVNIAKSPEMQYGLGIRDFCKSFHGMYEIGDYITLNVSCPNTEDGRTFMDPELLEDLLWAIQEEESSISQKKPILLKISPDLDFHILIKIIELSIAHSIQGFVVGNTTQARSGLKTPPKELEIMGSGGLSGLPLRKKSTEMIKFIYDNIKGAKIIGLGGIFSADDAFEKIKAGASLVQIYTGLIYRGPGLVGEINKGLVTLLEREGFNHLEEAIGKGMSA